MTSSGNMGNPGNSGNEYSRISVSRDTLRAELAEMELRLRNWLSEELADKADLGVVQVLATQVNDLRSNAVLREGPLMREFQEYQREVRRLSEGNFSEAQKRAIKIMMDETLHSHVDIGWTTRQRWIAVISLILSFVGVLSGIGVLIVYVIG